MNRLAPLPLGIEGPSVFKNAAGSRQPRILIFAPTGSDGPVTGRFLSQSGSAVHVCADMAEVCKESKRGCDLILLAEETLNANSVKLLTDGLTQQPPWSDIPITIITSGGEASHERLRILDSIGPTGNVGLLERPFRRETLLSTVEVALRARKRQYEVRDLLQEQRRTNENLIKAHATLQTVLSSINDGLLVLDKDWRCTYFSEQGARLLGVQVDELIGQCVWELFPQAQNTKFYEGYHQAVKSGKPIHFDEYHPAPSNRWLECHCYPSEAGLSVYFHDITDRKKAEDAGLLAENALREANAQLADKATHLESLVQQRTGKLRESVGDLEAFSYSIAHDMRAPLRSLQSFSEILLLEYGTQLDADGQEYLQRIVKSAGRMDKLIQDVLNYSKVVQGDLALGPVDLNSLLRDILDTYPMFAADQVDVVLKGAFPPVLGNEAMLTQILSNLMGNAIKFVAPGVRPRITINAERTGEAVRLKVRDNGIGIDADQQTKIFEIFQQVDQSYEGTGIGLAIVKKAVDRMGGKLGLESTRGQGSTFWIELQAA